MSVADYLVCEMCGHKAVYVGTQDPELIDVFVIHKVCDGGLTSAEKAVERVRELHFSIHITNYHDNGTGQDVCYECDEYYPCCTIQALDGEK